MAGDGNNSRPGSTRREDSFLARWSRRKHQAEHGIAVDETEPAATPADPDEQSPGTDTVTAADEAATAAPGRESADAEAVDADLPHPDTLDRDSDFSVYLTKRVSSAFRRAAMRRLFSSPEFNVRDGLDDYDDDYTQFQSLGNTVTAHMRHHAERLRQREQEKAEQAERDAEAERERTAEQGQQGEGEPERTAERDTDATRTADEQQAGTADDPAPADDAPDPAGTARTATNRDTDDTT